MSSPLSRRLHLHVEPAGPWALPPRPAAQAFLKLPDAPTLDAAAVTRRTRIWELSDNLHCSIVGTCFSTAELRQVLVKLKLPGVDTADEHELHMVGVTLAGRPDLGAKLLQKALDRRHGLNIKQYTKAKTEAALLDLWETSVRNGDIPGAYWATLTHPVASHAIVKRAFGDVHMLSHLVGAANRADIRRLRQLEEDNALLRIKIEKQQQQLHDGFTARDDTIRRLNDALAQRMTQSGAPDSLSWIGEGDEPLRLLMKDTERRLASESARRERFEQRCEALAATLNEREQTIRALRRECDVRQRELELIEGQLDASPSARHDGPALDLSGLTVLYVGGRTHQVPQLGAFVERCGAQFLDHDGGIDQNTALLPGLVSRSDIVLFPVDCVSHDSATRIKRLCRQAAKPFHPLRTSSLSTLMAALSGFVRSREMLATE